MTVETVDFLLVSPGTTAGWRHADAEIARALEELGASVATCTSEFRLARHLRRTVLMTDLAEAGAMRRALTRALRRWRPRAILYSSPQAAMLQPRSRLGRAAVRYDVPAARNRSGAGSSLLHALERRALGSARLLLPIGVEPAPAQRIEGVDTPMVALPIPIDAPAGGAEREPMAITYAGNPDKKGLDLALDAWASARADGWRLVVTGIDAERGRRFLAGRNLREPEDVEWAGTVDRERYRELLRRAAVYVSASRYEDYGLAQLEALAAGMLLVTVPSDGALAALPHARELNPALVAADVSGAALARALEAAFALGPEARRVYAERARVLVRAHSRETLRERLAAEVLPVLLG